MMDLPAPRIVITGAAGLVGQNLIVRLKRTMAADIIGIDKHTANTPVLARLHPDIRVIEADLARDDGWQPMLAGTDVLVIAHAQIGGEDEAAFLANNVLATERLLTAAQAHAVPRLVHLSSSVVNSAANDYYTETKKAQEALVLASGIPAVVLRPTLMFGWFDRKHLGWLARFMKRVPVFPIPGNGRYRRQPLYAGDFCEVILACIAGRVKGGSYNISGLDILDYIDLIRMVREASGAKVPIVRIPVWLFRALLTIYAAFNRNPPFTTRQLAALSIPELFEVIDWPGIFGVRATPLRAALEETFTASPYAGIVLDF
jgi:nucleoside-diphosphate-sugar epimerase